MQRGDWSANILRQMKKRNTRTGREIYKNGERNKYKMSVDKFHRTESKFGVYDRARRIRKMVNDFLDRDFGIKVCKRDIRNAAVGKYRRLEDGSTEFYVRMPSRRKSTAGSK